MESHRDDIDLTAALQALRPTPRPDFVAALDARADAGFPPHGADAGSSTGRIAKPLRLGGRLRIKPRRLLAPVGACAVLAIAVATAVVAVTENGAGPTMTSHTSQSNPTAPSTPKPEGLDDQIPMAASGEASVASGSVQILKAQSLATQSLANGSGPYASKTDRRDIERSAQLVLGTDPAAVRDDAARVFETVHSYNGIVLRSSIRDGDSGEAGATFDLLIPTAKLGDALASFSEIAEVRSRHESTQDITAPTIGVSERLQDARAKVESLLAQLASADTDAEREAVEAELRRERFRVAGLRSRLMTLQRRANLSHVSLRIETGAADDQGGSDTGSWGAQDALGDAGHILGIAAGVTVIGLAIITPLALMAFLAWLLYRAWVRRSRDRALD
jgi:hypothetical protein